MRDASRGRQIGKDALRRRTSRVLKVGHIRTTYLLLSATAVALAAYAGISHSSKPLADTDTVGNASQAAEGSDMVTTQDQIQQRSSSGFQGDTNSSVANDTSVNVNGEDITVPANGSLHKDVHSVSGNTSIDISHTSYTSQGNTTIHLDVETHSSAEGTDDST